MNLRLLAIGLVLFVAVLPAAAGHDKSDVCTTDDGATYIGEIKSVQYACASSEPRRPQNR
ncbi:MAG: hypothetical protein WBM75_06835 [Polyangiales bacterium]